MKKTTIYFRIIKKPRKIPTILSIENDICLNHATLAPSGTHMAGGEIWTGSGNPENWGLKALYSNVCSRVGLGWRAGSHSSIMVAAATFFPSLHATHPTELSPPLTHSHSCKFLRVLLCQQLWESPDPRGTKGRVLGQVFWQPWRANWWRKKLGR